MALDPNFVIAPSLEMYFVSKDTGLPLVAGQVFFWQDNARTIPKPVYTLSGSLGNYTYTQLPNPCILSSVGTFQDANGNDIIPYYNPFDANGDIQLYYIEVFDQNNVLQFTRSAWPNTTAQDVLASQDITNFIPNGQFLLHNNIPASTANNFHPNRISQAVTQIAQGGWTFERNVGSTATDVITFPRFASYVTSPTGNPRYAVEINRTNAASDTINDLRLSFPDVNTFASNSQIYNLYFEGKSNSGSPLNNVLVIIRKFFGAGGSTTTESVQGTISLGVAYSKFNIPLLFGDNSGQTIGTGEDDYVQICLRFPPAGTQDVSFTNFCLTLDNIPLTAYPSQTEAQQLAPSTAGSLPEPDPNGMDLYLPIRYTANGFGFDDSDIGKIYGATYSTPNIGELKCDGTTYETSDYSSDGIPYARLQAKLFNGTMPIYGTGSAFVTALASTGATQNLIFTTNAPAAATAPANGTSSPGFTFTQINPPSAAGYGVTAYQFGTNGFYVRSTGLGLVTAPTAGTSGFSVNDYRNLSSVNTAHLFVVTTVAAAGIAPGSYFTFTAKNPGLINYYMWFTINGVGADPAPGGTGIPVNLLSTMSAQDVAVAVINALNGGQQYAITCTAAAGITGGNYFTFGTPNTNQYYVWYKKDGAGTDPDPAGTKLGIEVDIVTGDTNAQVASKTLIAINKAYFAVPDFRGMFLRGIDPNSTWDYEAATRFGMTPSVFGDTLGTFFFDQNISHNHTAASVSATTGTVTITGNDLATGNGFINFETNSTVNRSGTFPLVAATTTTTTIAYSGQQEACPVNAYVNWMIKY